MRADICVQKSRCSVTTRPFGVHPRDRASCVEEFDQKRGWVHPGHVLAG